MSPLKNLFGRDQQGLHRGLSLGVPACSRGRRSTTTICVNQIRLLPLESYQPSSWSVSGPGDSRVCTNPAGGDRDPAPPVAHRVVVDTDPCGLTSVLAPIAGRVGDISLAETHPPTEGAPLFAVNLTCTVNPGHLMDPGKVPTVLIERLRAVHDCLHPFRGRGANVVPKATSHESASGDGGHDPRRVICAVHDGPLCLLPLRLRHGAG